MALKRKRPQHSSAPAIDRPRPKLAGGTGSDAPRGARGAERHSYGGSRGRGARAGREGGKRFPRPSEPPRDGAARSILHDRDFDGDGDGAAAIGSVGRKKKVLEGETRSYFLEIAALIDGGGGGDEAENDAEIICAQALAEARGQELQVACDASCGRVIESLLRRASVSQNIQFLLGCGAAAADMAMDASGSHVVEQVLKSITGALLDENVKDDESFYDSLELALTMLCQELGPVAMRVMTNTYGSHVLRLLLLLLSGNSSEILSPQGSDSNPKRGLAGKVGAFSGKKEHLQHPRTRSQAFPALLKSLVSMIMENCEGKMARLRADVSGGPVLQILLSSLKDLQMNEDVGRAIAAILGCDPKTSDEHDGELLESVSEEEIGMTMEDKSSSHLMEVIIGIASDALYLEIFRRFLRKRLVQLSLHPSANFIVQVVIASARHEGQVNMMFEELEGCFADLVKNKRTGVIAALLAACGRFRTRQKEACRALWAINSGRGVPSSDVVPRLLQMDFASDEGSGSGDKSHAKLSVIGSVILQTVLTFPQECCQQFCASIAAMEPAGLLRLVRDSSGSRVIEVFLDSSAAPMNHKLRVISKLEGHFAELALHPVGCFVVERCFGVAEIKRKEKIAAELAPVQSDLMKTRSGSRVSRRCDVTGFIENAEKWRTRESSKKSIQKAFFDIFKSGDVQDVASSAHDEDEIFVKKGAKGNKGFREKGRKHWE